MLLEKSEKEKLELQKALEENRLKEESPVDSPLTDTEINRINFNPGYKQIDEIISSNSAKEMQELLSAAKRMGRRGDIQKLTYVFGKLNEQTTRAFEV